VLEQKMADFNQKMADLFEKTSQKTKNHCSEKFERLLRCIGF
jgi:hypothetical protein